MRKYVKGKFVASTHAFEPINLDYMFSQFLTFMVRKKNSNEFPLHLFISKDQWKTELS
jgi:acyl carrier protein phosphodiesterase